MERVLLETTYAPTPARNPEITFILRVAAAGRSIGRGNSKVTRAARSPACIVIIIRDTRPFQLGAVITLNREPLSAYVSLNVSFDSYIRAAYVRSLACDFPVLGTTASSLRDSIFIDNPTERSPSRR